MNRTERLDALKFNLEKLACCHAADVFSQAKESAGTVKKAAFSAANPFNNQIIGDFEHNRDQIIRDISSALSDPENLIYLLENPKFLAKFRNAGPKTEDEPSLEKPGVQSQYRTQADYGINLPEKFQEYAKKELQKQFQKQFQKHLGTPLQATLDLFTKIVESADLLPAGQNKLNSDIGFVDCAILIALKKEGATVSTKKYQWAALKIAMKKALASMTSKFFWTLTIMAVAITVSDGAIFIAHLMTGASTGALLGIPMTAMGSVSAITAIVAGLLGLAVYLLNKKTKPISTLTQTIDHIIPQELILSILIDSTTLMNKINQKRSKLTLYKNIASSVLTLIGAAIIAGASYFGIPVIMNVMTTATLTSWSALIAFTAVATVALGLIMVVRGLSYAFQSIDKHASTLFPKTFAIYTTAQEARTQKLTAIYDKILNAANFEKAFTQLTPDEHAWLGNYYVGQEANALTKDLKAHPNCTPDQKNALDSQDLKIVQSEDARHASIQSAGHSIRHGATSDTTLSKIAQALENLPNPDGHLTHTQALNQVFASLSSAEKRCLDTDYQSQNEVGAAPHERLTHALSEKTPSSDSSQAHELLQAEIRAQQDTQQTAFFGTVKNLLSSDRLTINGEPLEDTIGVNAKNTRIKMVLHLQQADSSTAHTQALNQMVASLSADEKKCLYTDYKRTNKQGEPHQRLQNDLKQTAETMSRDMYLDTDQALTFLNENASAQNPIFSTQKDTTSRCMATDQLLINGQTIEALAEQTPAVTPELQMEAFLAATSLNSESGLATADNLPVITTPPVSATSLAAPQPAAAASIHAASALADATEQDIALDKILVMLGYPKDSAATVGAFLTEDFEALPNEYKIDSWSSCNNLRKALIERYQSLNPIESSATQGIIDRIESHVMYVGGWTLDWTPTVKSFNAPNDQDPKTLQQIARDNQAPIEGSPSPQP